MPTCLSAHLNFSRKSIKLTALLLLSPLFFFGQTLTGLWTGALSNDSSTIRKDQSFEIALTEYRGKVYGYSRSEFIVDDTLYYVVKRVKGTIEGDICEVSDDELVAYNFRGKLDKGIKVTSSFRRNRSDSNWYLAGTWKTNATKKYYSVTGKVDLTEEKDVTASKIFPHLEELNLADDIAFYKERKEVPSIARMVKPEKIKTEYSTKTIELPNNNVAIAKPNLQRAEARPMPVTPAPELITATEDNGSSAINTSTQTITEEKTIESKDNIVAINVPRTETKNIPVTTVSVSPSQPIRTRVENKRPVASPSENKPTADIVVSTVSEKKEKNSTNFPVQPKTTPVAKTSTVEEPVISKTVTVNNTKQPDANVIAKTTAPAKSTREIKKPDITSAQAVKLNTIAATKPGSEKKGSVPAPVTAAVIPEIKKPAIDITAQAALIGGRKSEFSQVVSFKADSLELSLYDNGEIDGDTVSIYLNGEVIMSKQGLKASAIKKTIYITPGNEDFTLVLYAENLGKYPPNTGLLVVHDGDDIYNLRFSSDFQKNAGIVFRRKK